MKLILIFAQAITQQEQIIGFFYEAIYMFFSGLLLLFISTTRVVAQEVSDYSQLNEEDYSKIILPHYPFYSKTPRTALFMRWRT